MQYFKRAVISKVVEKRIANIESRKEPRDEVQLLFLKSKMSLLQPERYASLEESEREDVYVLNDWDLLIDK